MNVVCQEETKLSVSRKDSDLCKRVVNYQDFFLMRGSQKLKSMSEQSVYGIPNKWHSWLKGASLFALHISYFTLHTPRFTSLNGTKSKH